MKIICWFKGHTWDPNYDMNAQEYDSGGNVIWGPEYIDHYHCLRCNRIEFP